MECILPHGFGAFLSQYGFGEEAAVEFDSCTSNKGRTLWESLLNNIRGREVCNRSMTATRR